MRQLKRVIAPILLLIIALGSPLWSGTTGKIAGTIIDKMTNEPLPGANIVVVGTSLGSATDINGQYTILQVPPRTYAVTISFVGYKKVTINDVNVDIDQTTKIDIALEIEAIEVGGAIIIAERKLVKPDVATSVSTATSEEIQQLPVANVTGFISYQAGMQSGLQIRDGRSNEALFQVNGISLRDPRNNEPISAVPMSAVQEISVERGGFNAEYGQVRSGLVNVVTKEGSASGYSGSFTVRYSPPAQKHFDISPLDPNSMLLKPYVDDAVCWTGTKNGVWNKYVQNQYVDFKGWNEVSRILMEDKDPSNDLTPLAAQRLFLWQTRKDLNIKKPDYSIDAGFGGPVPFVSDVLGGLRFFASYRSERQMLLIPLSRDDYYTWDLNIRVNSDISSKTKLNIQFLSGKEYTLASNDTQGNYIRSSDDAMGSVSGSRPSGVWGVYNSLADINYQSYSAKVVHVFSQNTFLEVSLENIQRYYNIVAPPERNYAKIYEIAPGYFVDESPFGYAPFLTTDIAGSMDFGGHTALPRDYSKVGATTFKADFESQINFNNLVKTGVEFVYNNLNLDFGQTQRLTGGAQYANRVQLDIFPIRAAVYVQDKLEFEGFIANLGIRCDYSNSNTEWWAVNPFDANFFSTKYDASMVFPKQESKAQYQFSPRLGISHPITENSKLYFNYGHFKQVPSYQELFRIDRSSDKSVVTYGDPDLVLARTISYELGYDHSLFDDNLLLQVAGFYHDITNEHITDANGYVTYASAEGFSYRKTESNNYRDIRGFELTLRKAKGRYWTAFANYTYQVTTSGFFGKQQISQDIVSQRQYDENITNIKNRYQNRPIPRPYARINLALFTPQDIGSSFISRYLMGDWMLNMLVDWRVGSWETYNPNGVEGVVNNVQRNDYFNTQLRFSKNFSFKGLNVQFFVDIYNALNTRRMGLNNWGKSNDRDLYYSSLHLPKSEAYSNIEGDDRVGDYRKLGVAYQPIERTNNINNLSSAAIVQGAIYYEMNSKRYMEYVNGAWSEVEKGRMDKVLADKAYIDMPNLDSFTFLNPRQIFFGIQVSFDLN